MDNFSQNQFNNIQPLDDNQEDEFLVEDGMVEDNIVSQGVARGGKEPKPLYEVEGDVVNKKNSIDSIKSDNDFSREDENNKLRDIQEQAVSPQKIIKEKIDNITQKTFVPTSGETEEALDEKIKEIELERKEEAIQRKASDLGLGYINLKGLPIIPEALRLISEKESVEKGIICFMYKKQEEIRVAVLDNNNKTQEVVKRLAELHGGLSVRVYLTSQISMNEGIKLYKALPRVIKEIDEVEVLQSDLEKASSDLGNLKDLEEKIKNTSTTNIFSLILAAAIKMESSDIHIEAEQLAVQLRFRIDGVLHDVAKINKEDWDYLVSRIKLNAKLKINIKDKPQDGHFSVKIKNDPIDFRVSTLPTAFGESVVMRVLHHSRVQKMTLDNLGIGRHNREILNKEIMRPNGMIVVTGPTGSGKTTTLYAILNKLNTPDNKIITIEEPVEYKIEGINQSEVRSDKGYTFAKALRSVVRQDPDMILVGEIRDDETAEIALNAALTGHLVFTTLHTNDAVGAIPRFLSLGGKPYLLAPAINVSMAQRLVRKICNKCKEEVLLDSEFLERVKHELEFLPEEYKVKIDLKIDELKFYKGRGCEECSGLGYKGQIGVFEIFVITDEIRNLILSEGISEYKLKEVAIKNGMIKMVQDGIIKASRGITSLEEVFRVSQ